MIDTKALRQKILDLAMHGKLVEQDPKDEPASVLLEKIKLEKEQLIEDKKNKKEKPFPEIYKKEIPYEIPKNWEWVRLGNIILKTIGGGTPSKSNPNYWNGDIPWASVKDFKGETLLATKDFITEEGLFNSSSNYIEKDNLIVVTRMAVGKIAINKIDMAINQDLRALIINENILKKFIFYIYPRIQFEMKGITVKGITITELLNKPLALPPLSEQKRIVDKIEELFALIDVIEAKQTEYSNLAMQLDKKVLDIAMCGKLVGQDPTDESASVLLDKIKKEKEQLIKEKKINKEKSLPEISEEEAPFEIPESWKWTRLGKISTKIQYGYTDSAKQQGDAKFLRITDIQDGRVNWSKVPYCHINDSKLSDLRLEENDILIARTGGTIGKSFLVKEIREKAVFASYLIRIRLAERSLSEYVDFFLDSPLYWKLLEEISYGTGQPNVNGTNLSKLFIPLPPLEEQNRIVAKIERIRALI